MDKLTNYIAQREGRKARIVGLKSYAPATHQAPREATLARLARSTGNRPSLASLLAQAASTVEGWR